MCEIGIFRTFCCSFYSHNLLKFQSTENCRWSCISGWGCCCAQKVRAGHGCKLYSDFRNLLVHIVEIVKWVNASTNWHGFGADLRAPETLMSQVFRGANLYFLDKVLSKNSGSKFSPMKNCCMFLWTSGFENPLVPTDFNIFLNQ